MDPSQKTLRPPPWCPKLVKGLSPSKTWTVPVNPVLQGLMATGKVRCLRYGEDKCSVRQAFGTRHVYFRNTVPTAIILPVLKASSFYAACHSVLQMLCYFIHGVYGLCMFIHFLFSSSFVMPAFITFFCCRLPFFIPHRPIAFLDL